MEGDESVSQFMQNHIFCRRLTFNAQENRVSQNKIIK
jgi:hypothetical protein